MNKKRAPVVVSSPKIPEAMEDWDLILTRTELPLFGR
jgi:hypothetical protein